MAYEFLCFSLESLFSLPSTPPAGVSDRALWPWSLHLSKPQNCLQPLSWGEHIHSCFLVQQDNGSM